LNQAYCDLSSDSDDIDELKISK